MPLEEFGVACGTRWLQPHLDGDGKPITQHPQGRVRYTGLNQILGDTAQLRISAIGYETLLREDIQIEEGGETESRSSSS